LAFLVLLVLHLIHGSTLLLALFLHLVNHIHLSTSTCNNPSPKTLSEDVLIWKNKKRVPNCLGIIFVPSARGYFSLSKFKYTSWDKDIVLQGMVRDVLDLVNWSKRLGVDTLLLYDENGKLTLSKCLPLRALYIQPEPRA